MTDKITAAIAALGGIEKAAIVLSEMAAYPHLGERWTAACDLALVALDAACASATGEVQTLRARLSIAEADRNAVAVRELEEAQSWLFQFRQHGYPNAMGVAAYCTDRIAALSEKPAETTPDAGDAVLREWVSTHGQLRNQCLSEMALSEICRRELARKGAK